MTHGFSGVYSTPQRSKYPTGGARKSPGSGGKVAKKVAGQQQTPLVQQQTPLVQSPIRDASCKCNATAFQHELATMRKVTADQDREIGFLKGKVQSLEDQMFFLMESITKREETQQTTWAQEKKELMESVELLRTGNEQLLALAHHQPQQAREPPSEHHAAHSIPMAPIQSHSIRNIERAWSRGGGGGSGGGGLKLHTMQCLILTEGSKGQSVDVAISSPPPWELPSALTALVDAGLLAGATPAHLSTIMFCLERNGVRTVIENPHSPNIVVMQEDRLCVVILLQQGTPTNSPRINASRLWRDRRPSLY